MSKKKVLMRRKIKQAVAKGHSPTVVIPSNCKNQKLIQLATK